METIDENQNVEIKQDSLEIYGEVLASRLFLGTAQYPSLKSLEQAIEVSTCSVVTMSLQREQGGDTGFWQSIKSLTREHNIQLLPNTAGCHSVEEVIKISEMSRELFQTNWIKVEITGDNYNLQPNPFLLPEVVEKLIEKGFKVFPYSTDDLVLCTTLADLGCEVVMPWAAPIGSGMGVVNPYQLQQLRDRLPNTKLVVDAGIGKPSEACQVMEFGFDAVLLNTAVSQSIDPPKMAKAFAQSIQGGRDAYLSGLMSPRSMAQASTIVPGVPMWHQD